MRILYLDLKKFGPFTDKMLDLSGGQEGFHIIYGLNEAGKSAALRALKALFYGIDHQTKDNFLHDNQDLRVGAGIRRFDKNELEFIRRKGTKNTLLGLDERPLPDMGLHPYLGGVTSELFSTLFGIDYKTLVEGGVQLIAAGGHLGESLFAAGMGIAGLRDILKDLHNEASDLFKPGGSIPVINTLISQYNKFKKKSRELSLSGREWRDHDKALNEAKLEREKVQKELNKLRIDKTKIERLKESLPIITERREALNELKALKDVPLLDQSFSDERRNANRKLDEAKAGARKAEDDLDLIINQKMDMSVPEHLAAQDKIITELHKRLGGQIKAQQDLPVLEREWETLAADANKILSELRPELRLEDAAQLRITEIKRALIHDLGAQHQTLLNESIRTSDTLDELEVDLAGAKEAFQKIAAPLNASDLRTAFRRAQKCGDLDERLKTALAKLEKEETEAQIALKALPLWIGTIEELEELALPSSETVEFYRSEIGEIDGKVRELEDRIKESKVDDDKLDKQIKALRIAGSVPTEQELIEARQRRNYGWDLVRSVWLDGEDVQEEIKEFEPNAPLHEAYEKSVNQADEISDRLRRETRRVEKLAQLIASREQCAEKLKALKRERKKILDEQDNLDKDWKDHWNRFGIEPRTPKEMSAWINKQEKIAAKCKNIREYRDEVARIENLIQEHTKVLIACLNSLGLGLGLGIGIGETQTLSYKSVNDLFDRCQVIIDEIEEIARQRKELEKKIKDIEKKRASAARKNHQAQINLDKWNESWGKAVSDLGLSKETVPSQANAFIEKTKGLFEKIDKAEGLDRRIKGIKSDTGAFERDVKSLLEEVAPDLLKAPVYQSVETLNTRLNKAREDMATLKQLEKRRGEKDQALKEANTVINKMTEKLKDMCRQAGCSDYEDLEEIGRKSEEKSNLEKRISQLESQLKRISHTGGLTIDKLIEDAGQVDPDGLVAQIESAERDIEEQQDLLSDLDNTIGREQKELEVMEGGPEAAKAAEEAQGILAEIKSNTEQYMRLRMASAILSREIELYREANQDPILQRASQIFSKLTSGSFSGLKPSFDDRDNPVLTGVRPGGEEVLVGGMSDGTCDQLYLSLRLASIEKHIKENEPMPFIVDDILINFDDERAKATMEVLSELSNKTQIIFFTHHSHLKNLAKETVPENVLYLKHLHA